MTGLALTSAPVTSRSRSAINPWFVAAVVVVPTFMEVLDTTIAVVALRCCIAGGLSATVVDGEWVITSYLGADAIIPPITGWLIAHLGRRNYFLLSIAVFTPAARSFLDPATGPFLQQTGDPVAAQRMALQTLANMRLQQASALAYFDVFWVLAVVMAALLFVLLLMKRSVAEKGARIVAE